MAETLLIILTAHLLGDFIFQNSWIVENKKSLPVLLLHIIIITAVTALLLRTFHRDLLVSVALSHLLIDLIKQRFGKDTAVPFLVDQLAHIATLFLIAGTFPDAAEQGWWPQSLPPDFQSWFHVSLCLVSGAILTVTVGGILVGKLTKPLSEQFEESTTSPEGQALGAECKKASDNPLAQGLTNGGKYIGWLERSMTMLFILIGQPTGIGFVLAAKSILRFGEIKDPQHRKITEYIIIGSFISFGWALLTSVIMQKSIEYWTPHEDDELKAMRVIVEQGHTSSSPPPPPTTPTPPTATTPSAP